MQDLSGQQLKGYEIQECIGAGGFGAVYRAYQPAIHREVAIKIILPGVAHHPDFVRRFEMEAQLVARLEHMNIVPLYDYWRDKDGAYLVMRWLRGGSLRDKLAHGACTLEETGRIVSQLTSALTTAHRNNVIHRDLKPANVVLDEQGNAYLSDFGIAKDNNSIDGSLTDADAVVGSLDYISPEQARSEPVTPRTDIYSLGVMVYEMLVGEHPFPQAKSIERLYKHLNERLPKITSLPVHIANSVNEVIQKATAKDPLQRYGSALEFANAFMEAAQLVSHPIGASVVELLTVREQEVLQLMMNNYSNKEIADQLVVSVNTVKYFQKQIYSKLRVRNRVQAIVRARELDLAIHADNSRQANHTSLTTQLPEPTNPYKGLEAFQAADSQQFFGRERLVERIMKRLCEKENGSRFLAVVGPSGSGKSSVVKAGVIPALWRGELPGSDHWFIAEMTPGTHPLEELEIALSQISTSATTDIMQQLQRDDRGLLRAVRMILPEDNSELVLVIDQFEEVFTLVEDESQRGLFLKLLFNAASDSRSRIRIIITLRADFYDRPLRYVEFGEMLRNRMETVLPLSAEELERAIVIPARNEGVQFEAGLAAAIVSEVNYQPGALPMLQYALTELFERRQQRLLTREAYENIGGTVGALAKRADELYLELDDAGQAIVQQMFMRLVTLGEGTEDTRRRVNRLELMAVCSDADLLEEVIDTFVSYRLLSLDHDPITRTPTVEIAHEAILSVWKRLQAWINDNREEIRMQQQLTRMAAEWQQASRDPSYLASGLRLEQMEAWAHETQLALSSSERQFLEASIADRNQRKQLEQAQKAHVATLEQRSVQRLQLVVVILVVAMLVSMLFAGIAVTQRNQAKRIAEVAQQQANENRGLYLTNEAQEASRNGDPLFALALAVEAFRTDSNSEQSYQILDEMLRLSPAMRRFVGHTDDVTTVAYSPDGQTAVSGSLDSTVILWNIATGEMMHRLEAHTAAVNDVAFSPDGAMIVSASSDNSLILWNAATGDMMQQLTGHNAVVRSVAFSRDSQTIISGGCSVSSTACPMGELIVWDAATGELLSRLQVHNGFVSSIVFSPNGQQVLTASANDVILWQFADGMIADEIPVFTSLRGFREVFFNLNGSMIVAALADGSITGQFGTSTNTIPIIYGETIITTVAFSPDFMMIVSAQDSMLALTELQSKGRINQFVGHTDAINAVAFSPDGATLLSGSSDDTLILWQTTSQPVRRFAGHQDDVFSLAISPDGSRVLGGGGNYSGHAPSADEDANNYIIVWDAATGELLHRFEHSAIGIEDIEVSPDSRLVVSSLNVDVVGVWDLQSGELLHRFEGIPAKYFDISPDGQTVLSGNDEGYPVLWDIQTGQILRSFTEYQVPTARLTQFSVDGTFAISMTMDGIVLWDIQTGAEIRRFRIPLGQAWDFDLSPDGHFLAVSAIDEGMRIVDLNTGEIMHHFPEYNNGRVLQDHRTGGVAFSPDGESLLTGWGTSAVVLWNLQTGSPLHLGNHGGSALQVAFMPDGSPVSSSDDGTVALWGVGRDSILDWVAANRYVRDFTCREREAYRIGPLCDEQE